MHAAYGDMLGVARNPAKEKTQGDKIWKDAIHEEFAASRNAVLTNPLMDEIERIFAKKH